MDKKVLLKAGCLLTSIIFIGFIGFISFTLVDTYNLSNHKAKKIVADSDFQKIERYLKAHKEIKFIRYKGDNQSKQEKLWQINNFLVDYDNSLVVNLPKSLSYFTNQELMNNPSAAVKMSIDDFIKADTLAPKQLDIKSLDSILIKIKKFEFISVSVDSVKIDYRLRFNSPISQGFGILGSLENKDLNVENSGYVEFTKLDDKHFKYKEFVD